MVDLTLPLSLLQGCAHGKTGGRYNRLHSEVLQLTFDMPNLVLNIVCKAAV
jgi:hypothetical protein